MGDNQATETDEVNYGELQQELRTDRFVDPDPVTAAAVLSGAAGRTPLQILLDAVELAKRDLPPDASDEVQNAVADLLRLMEALLDSSRAVTRMAMAEFALHRLIKAPTDLTLARRVIKDLRSAAGGRTGLWFSRFRAATPPHVDVVMGLALSVAVFGGAYLAGGMSLFRMLGLSPQVAPNDFLERLIWLGAVGAFGSVISILTRLNQFAEQKSSRALLDFMNGFFKPVIGLASANLAFVLIESQLIPLSFQSEEATRFAMIGIAFVAGFSERLVKDLASIVERTIGAAGERGIEMQRTGAVEVASREIADGLSGRTEVSRADLYASLDVGDPDEQIHTEWEEDAPAAREGS